MYRRAARTWRLRARCVRCALRRCLVACRRTVLCGLRTAGLRTAGLRTAGFTGGVACWGVSGARIDRGAPKSSFAAAVGLLGADPLLVTCNAPAAVTPS